MISIAIKTADRSPKRNYLGETLRNLERGGVFSSRFLAGPVILSDTGKGEEDWFVHEVEGVPVTVAEWAVDRNGLRTLHKNATNAISRAANTDADWVLVLEDDIDVCANFLESIEKWLAKYQSTGPMMYAFGANYAQIRNARAAGYDYWSYPCHAFYGALACLWRRRDARALLEWYGPMGYERDGHLIEDRGHDLKLAKWGKSVGITHYMASAPCFVDHIGNESGLGNKAIRYAGFAGREWSYESV